MNNENELDYIDEFLFDYFEKIPDGPIPACVENSINEALNQINATRDYSSYINIFSKVAIIIIASIIMTTNAVFAKDIIKFIKELFTNSTKSINVAVENNYVQEINGEYVYDNDIGIALKYLLVDDTKLDLAISYKYVGDKAIEEIKIKDFALKSEDGVIYDNLSETKGKKLKVSDLKVSELPIEVEDNCFKDSILIMSKDFSNYNKIILEVKSVRIKTNNKYSVVKGDWLLETNVDNNVLKRNIINYKILDNDYIKSGSAKLSETTLKINLEFKSSLENYEKYATEENFILRDEANKEYFCRRIELLEKNVYLEYDISKYSKDIDKLELIMNLDENIKLELTKEK